MLIICKTDKISIKPQYGMRISLGKSFVMRSYFTTWKVHQTSCHITWYQVRCLKKWWITGHSLARWRFRRKHCPNWRYLRRWWLSSWRFRRWDYPCTHLRKWWIVGRHTYWPAKWPLTRNSTRQDLPPHSNKTSIEAEYPSTQTSKPTNLQAGLVCNFVAQTNVEILGK